MIDWQNHARALIAEVHASLPADASFDDRRRALRKRASDCHLGTSWGKKVWQKHCRRYLHAYDTQPRDLTSLEKAIAGRDDIIFPFRGSNDL